ncbi:hypothetical protein NLU13_7806 [Sarocladium strictum]|uniref:Methyltransferase domain-containing protein n=1 Tax=Sarocladium strictum TaxID=5046 RepID=A0AA39GDG7_SARSR|nr:hypothetical protein NLU13_7806 [Sarocladium strictum]
MDCQSPPDEQLGPSLDNLLDCHLHDKKHRPTAIVPTFVHRLKIADAWAIPRSARRLLDIGCGQGESTLILANTNSEVHATGVDSGPADYGSPYTLGQSQAFTLASPLGQRIAFERADPVSYLRDGKDITRAQFDAAFFCHSLWYWSSADEVRNVFSALAETGVPQIYIAEWAGEASRPEQEAHALAAKAQKELYAERHSIGGSRLLQQNIRTGFLPDELFALAAEAGGWKVARRGVVTAPSDLMDGVWETDYVKSENDWKRGIMELDGLSEEKKQKFLQYSDQVKEAVERCGGRKEVRCMDAVWAVLERD